MLKHHCAFCNQWIADASKMKNRYRQSHESLHSSFLVDAAKLCSRFNTPGAPCEHCGTQVKAARQHPAKCTVLWQICVMHLSKCSEPPRNGATANGSLRPSAQRATVSTADGGDERRPQQGSSRGPCARVQTEQGTAQRRGQRGATYQGRKSHDGPHLLPLVKALCRLSLQQETTIKVLQQDTAWVLFLQPAEAGALKMLFKAAQTWKEAHQQYALRLRIEWSLIYRCPFPPFEEGATQNCL